MKKCILSLIGLFLSACVDNQPLPYKCEVMDHNDAAKYNVFKGDYLCFSETVINDAHSLNYSTDSFAEFADYAIINKKTYKTHNPDNLFSMYYADKYGEKIPSNTTIHVIDPKMFNDYKIYKKRKENEKIEQQKKQLLEKKKQVASQYPEIKKELKKQFFNMCQYNLQNGRIQLNHNYIQQICECLACIYDGIAGDYAVYDYVKGNEKTVTSYDYTNVVYHHFDQCDKYITGIADFNPCNWAKGEDPFK